MRRCALVMTLATCALSGCMSGDYRNGGPERAYAYDGREWAGEPRRPYEGELHGPGVEILDDWLKETREGQAIVTLGFRDAGEGLVSEDVAHRANVWFRRYADQDRDMTITDPEIRTALVAAAGRYLPRR